MSLGLSMYHVMCAIQNLKLQYYVHIMSVLIEDLTLSLLVAVFLLIAVVQTALDQKVGTSRLKKSTDIIISRVKNEYHIICFH